MPMIRHHFEIPEEKQSVSHPISITVEMRSIDSVIFWESHYFELESHSLTTPAFTSGHITRVGFNTRHIRDSLGRVKAAVNHLGYR